MKKTITFDLIDFVPYLLNQAADASSIQFQKYYKTKYNMLRTEWRVVFHLGRYGEMTAKEICDRARIHKTKVSRAVTALGHKRFLAQKTKEDDRRYEMLFLTKDGRRVYADLSVEAQNFNNLLLADVTPEEREIFFSCLRRMAKL